MIKNTLYIRIEKLYWFYERTFTFNVHLTLRNCIITRRWKEHLFFNAWTLRRIICFVNFWICVLNIESIQYDRTCICKVVTNMPGLLIRSYYESKISCTRCEMNFELRIILNINFYLLKKMKIFEIFVLKFLIIFLCSWKLLSQYT